MSTKKGNHARKESKSGTSKGDASIPVTEEEHKLSAKELLSFKKRFPDGGEYKQEKLLRSYYCATSNTSSSSSSETKHEAKGLFHNLGILTQGILYASNIRLCFYAKIFNKKTKIVIDFKDIKAIEKKNTASIIPNAIEVDSQHEKYWFTSFINRDSTYNFIHKVWTDLSPSTSPKSSNEKTKEKKRDAHDPGALLSDFQTRFNIQAAEKELEAFDCEFNTKRGTVYIFKDSIFFYSESYGEQTKQTIPLNTITSVEPSEYFSYGAIDLTMKDQSKSLFIVFKHRDEALNMLKTQWQMHKNLPPKNKEKQTHDSTQEKRDKHHSAKKGELKIVKLDEGSHHDSGSESGNNSQNEEHKEEHNTESPGKGAFEHHEEAKRVADGQEKLLNQQKNSEKHEDHHSKSKLCGKCAII